MAFNPSNADFGPGIYTKPLDELSYNERLKRNWYEGGQKPITNYHTGTPTHIGYADDKTYGSNTGWLRDYYGKQGSAVPINLQSGNIEDIRREQFGLPAVQQQAPQQAPQQSSSAASAVSAESTRPNPFLYMGRNPYQYETPEYSQYMANQSSAFDDSNMQTREFQQYGFGPRPQQRQSSIQIGFGEGSYNIPGAQYNQNPYYWQNQSRMNDPQFNTSHPGRGAWEQANAWQVPYSGGYAQPQPSTNPWGGGTGMNMPAMPDTLRYKQWYNQQNPNSPWGSQGWQTPDQLQTGASGWQGTKPPPPTYQQGLFYDPSSGQYSSSRSYGYLGPGEAGYLSPEDKMAGRQPSGGGVYNPGGGYTRPPQGNPWVTRPSENPIGGVYNPGGGYTRPPQTNPWGGGGIKPGTEAMRYYEQNPSALPPNTRPWASGSGYISNDAFNMQPRGGIMAQPQTNPWSLPPNATEAERGAYNPDVARSQYETAGIQSPWGTRPGVYNPGGGYTRPRQPNPSLSGGAREADIRQIMGSPEYRQMMLQFGDRKIY